MKVFGFAGQSGSGKTTVIENLIPLFSGFGLTVSVIKHTHHSFDVDSPGKDSWRQRRAGDYRGVAQFILQAAKPANALFAP